MGDIPPSPSSFKNALSFFSNLDRPSTSPLIPRRNASNFEVNLKLIIDSQTVSRTTYDVTTSTPIAIPQIIPRARLTRKQDEVEKRITRNIPAQDYQRPSPRSSQAVLGSAKEPAKFMPIVPPKVPLRPFGVCCALVPKPAQNPPTPNREQRDQLTPDVEAKQILDAFNKEITPFNTFAVSISALDSEFLTLANSGLDGASGKQNERRSRSIYGSSATYKR